MAENKSEKLPQFNSTKELIDFFDTRDLGDYESDMSETNFDVAIEQKHYLVSVDEKLMNGLLEIANKQQVSVEILVNSWLKERILKAN